MSADRGDAKQIFVTFAGDLGRKYKDELPAHIETFGWRALIDERLAGGEWEPKVIAMAKDCDAAIALVDADWLNSEFVNDHEAPVCLGRDLRGEIRFVPIQLLNVHASLAHKTYGIESPSGVEQRSLTEISWAPSSQQDNGKTGYRAPPLLADPLSPNRRSLYYQEALALVAKFFAEDPPRLPAAPPPIEPPSVLEAFERASKVLFDYPRKIDKQWMERPQVEELWTSILNSPSSTTILVGPPGSGKSSFLAELAARAHARREQGWVVLAIKADLLPSTVTDAESLATALELTGPPAEQVWALAETGKRCLVLVDQLDVLLDLAGAHLHRLAAVLEFIKRVSSFDRVHVVTSCRRKEYERNARLLGIEPVRIPLELPSISEVEKILARQPKLVFEGPIPAFLRVPLYLRLLIEHVDELDPLERLGSGGVLLDRIIARLSPDTVAVAIGLAIEMGKREQLWLPRDAVDHDLRPLEGLELGRWKDERFRFCHQLVFEAFWARSIEQEGFGAILDSSQTTTTWARIRNALRHLQARSPSCFVAELRGLWNSERLVKPLRFVLLDVVAQNDEPSTEEADWLREQLAEERWREHAMQRLQSVAWFDHLADDLDAILGGWDEVGRSTERLLRAAARARPDQVITLLRAHWLAPEMTRSALWIARRLPLSNPLARELWRELVASDAYELERFLGFVKDQVQALDEPGFVAELVGRHVAARLRSVLAEEPGDFSSTDRIANVLGLSWYYAEDALQRAPERFLDHAWDVLQRAAERGQTSAPRWGGYPESEAYPGQALDSEDELHSSTVRLFEISLLALARCDHMRFARFIRDSAPAPINFVHRLIAAALEHAPPEVALDFLEAHPRHLGTSAGRGGYPWPVRRLLGALADKANGQQLHQLEQLVRHKPSMFADPEQSSDEERRRARSEFDDGLTIWLLHALPQETLGEDTREWMRTRSETIEYSWPEQEQRSWRASVHKPEPTFTIEPDMSDEELHVRLRELPSDTSDTWTVEDEIAGLLGQSPQRADAILGDLSLAQLEQYLRPVLRRWAQKHERDAVLRWVRIADERGCESHDFRTTAARALEAVSKGGLDDSVCALLQRWLDSWDWKQESTFVPTPSTPKPTKLMVWSTSPWSTSSATDVLSALLLGLLLREPPAVERALEALNHYAEILQTPGDLIKFEGLGWFTDQVIEKLFDIIEARPKLIESSDSVGVLWRMRTANASLEPRFRAALERLRDSDWDLGPRAYAEFVCVVALWPGYTWAKELVEDSLNAPLGKVDAHMTTALTVVAAEAFHAPNTEALQDECLEWLRRVAPHVAEVGVELRRVWRSPLHRYRWSDEPTDARRLMPLMQAAATYPALLESARDTLLVVARDVVEESPAHAFALTNAYVRARGSSLAMHDHKPLTQIIMSLQRSPGYRSAAFDLLELLFEHDVWQLDRVLDELEYPTT